MPVSFPRARPSHALVHCRACYMPFVVVSLVRWYFGGCEFPYNAQFRMVLFMVLYPMVESEVFLPCLALWVCLIRSRRSPLGVGLPTCAFAVVSVLAKLFSFFASFSSWFPRFVDLGFGDSSSRSSSGVLFVFTCLLSSFFLLVFSL